MNVSDFDYYLPETSIAQNPATPRDASRLLVLNRSSGITENRTFRDLLDYLQPGDVLVVNDTRVIPARLFGRKSTGGAAEILLLEQQDRSVWRVLIGGRRLNEGTVITVLNKSNAPTELTATVISSGPESLREVRFSHPIDEWLDSVGHVPLPPYIHAALEEDERYQTIYSRPTGSAAAPTAGLHFTPELLLGIRDKGVILESVTLHVGLDTFKPVTVDQVADHVIHSEWARLAPESAKRINEAKLAGGRIIAVGTTTVRVLETAALRSAGILGSLQTISQSDAAGETSNLCPWKPVAAFEGHTDLFITPGYRFRAVEAIVTNFHLPRSSLLMLVSAFAGRDRVLEAYNLAVAEGYRFYSFGDAMFIH